VKSSRPNFFVLLFLLGWCVGVTAAFAKPHILFIAVDDLRPELGCYGSELAKTPHIDALAASGLLFERAYCQQAICSPSRASLMTGARPDTIGVIENTAYFRDLNPEIITLPQHLRSHGYETVYCGKIFHNNKMDDQELSWSRGPAWKRLQLARPTNYALPENLDILKANRVALTEKYGPDGIGGLVHGPAYEAANVPDESYPDGHSARLASRNRTFISLLPRNTGIYTTQRRSSSRNIAARRKTAPRWDCTPHSSYEFGTASRR